MAKKESKQFTIKQRRFLELLKESLGDKKPKSIYQMLLEAGYEEGSARQQTNILESKGIKRESKTIIEQLEKKRQMAINKLTSKKMDSAQARDLASIIDILTKNTQLLGGGATERNEITGFNYIKPKDKATESSESNEKEKDE